MKRPTEKFVVVRTAASPGGQLVAQVQHYAGQPAYYPDAAAAHNVASLLGGRRAGYTVESRFVDCKGRETSLRLQAVPVAARMVIGAR